MPATSLDLSQIKTDALSSAATFRALIGLGTLATVSPTGTPNGTKFLRDDGSWQVVNLSAYLPLAGGTMTGALAITQGTANTSILTSTGYSLTGSNAQSLIDVAGTWNTSGTPTAFKLNVTDTASNAASLLMDLQVGGSSRFSVSKAGLVTLAESANIAVGTTTGTKIGTATTQKLGFFNATPVVQQTLTTDLLDSLQNLGLIASGSGDTPLNLTNGTITAGAAAFSATVTTTETANTPTGTTQTVNLNSGNHQTLDLGSASGAVTATLTVPSSSSAGTIILLQGATVRNVTWAVSSGTIVWMGTEPTWSSDLANRSRIIAWRWNGSVMRLAPSESS